MNRELLLLVDALSREKNVPKEIVFTALESALASATKKRFADDIDARASKTLRGEFLECGLEQPLQVLSRLYASGL